MNYTEEHTQRLQFARKITKDTNDLVSLSLDMEALHLHMNDLREDLVFAEYAMSMLEQVHTKMSASLAEYHIQMELFDYDHPEWRDPNEDLEALPIKNLSRYERRLASSNKEKKRLLTSKQEEATCDLHDLVILSDEVPEHSLCLVPYQTQRVS